MDLLGIMFQRECFLTKKDWIAEELGLVLVNLNLVHKDTK